jgi:P27 family predicted phage terminase small subunit
VDFLEWFEMRGRKPKPTILKVIEGNPGKRDLPDDPVEPLSALPPAPENLSPVAKEVWQRIGQELFTLRILTSLDLEVFEPFCEAVATFRAARDELRRLAALPDIESKIGRHLMLRTKNGNWVQTPLIGTMNCASDKIRVLAAELGLTPSSRARVLGGSPAKQSKWQGLIGARRA